MNWQDFNILLFYITALWLIGSLTLLLDNKRKLTKIFAQAIIILGCAIFYYFVVAFWIEIDRPPFRTTGETRMWYSVFISMMGLALYYRYKYKLLIILSLAFALLFLWINYFTPANYDKNLMPALQSPWFIPHVVVYMMGYAVLGSTVIVSLIGLYARRKKQDAENFININANLVYIGFALLTSGLLFGALWAKIAWGHYWTWDPKETWALISWLVYLLYIHFSIAKKISHSTQFILLIAAFIFVLICWLGTNYLPLPQESVHNYS